MKNWEYDKTNFDRNLAVVIGIDRYNSESIQNLRTPVSDARALADLLETEYGYEPENVVRLFDNAATLTGLQTLLDDTLPNQLKPTKGDRLIFYFAGHGIPRNGQDGPEGYLVPQDADSQKQDSFLPMSKVYEALSKLECHHLLVILDCCFAGTFRWAGRREMILILETVRREHYDRFIRYPAWQVMTSAAHDQEALDVAKLAEDKRGAVADEKQELHSPFALALLEGLRENKADLIQDGVITAHELYLYLEQQVSKLSGERQRPGIYPMRLEYDRGEFVFTRPGFTSEQLKPAPLLNESNNPYRGLASFDEKHAHFFFGRKALVEQLQRRLSQPNHSLTVVLGASGSGKSSLVKAGLIPDLRQESKWYILDPMRPDRSQFTALARAILPIEKPELLEQLSQVSFLDEVFKPKDESGQDDSDKPTDAAFVKLAESWNSATLEAKLLLVEDYFEQLLALCRNPQEKEQLSQLYRTIFEKLESLSTRLQTEPQHLTRIIRKWSQTHPDAKLLLTIDQFEELITMSQESQTETHGGDRQEGDSPNETVGERAAEPQPWLPFLQVLREAIVECPQQLHIVLTLRSDFEPRFLSSPLSAYWKDARFPVRAMNLDELRQAIEGPALKQALYFEPPELVGKLIDEVGQMPGALPLLSFTLSELYIKLHDRWAKDNATDRALRIKDYEELGGVAGALTRRASQEYDNLVRDFGEASGKAYQATMRRVMLRMVAIEGGEVARRRVPEPELVYPDSEENKRVAQVSDRLIKARLLVKGQETGEPYVEPAHDFLVRSWDQLQGWIKDEQEELALQQRLTIAVNDWYNKSKQETQQKNLLNIWRQAETFVIRKVQNRQLNGERRKQKQSDSSKRSGERPIQYLWDDDPRLEQLKRILVKNNWFNRTEDTFVRESLIERQRNTSRLTAIVTTVGIGLMGLTIAALYQAQLSSLREKAAVARNRLSTAAPINGLVLAIEATGQNRFWIPWNMLSSVQSSLLTALEEAKESSRFTIVEQNSIETAAFSPDGKYIATGDGFTPVGTPGLRPIDGTIWLRDLQGKPISKPMPHRGRVEYIAFSSNGKYIASRDLEEEFVKIWDLQGNLIKKEPSSSFSSISSPDLPIISIENKKISFLQGNSAFGSIEALSPDSKYIAITQGVNNVIAVQDKTLKENDDNQQKLTSLRGCEGYINAIKFSQDNRYITGVCSDATIRNWQLQDNSITSIQYKHDESSGAFTFNVNSQSIISSGGDRTIRIWDLKGKERHSFKTSEDSIYSFAVSPNGQYIVGGGGGSSLQLWDANGNRINKPFKGHEHIIESVAFSRDNKYIISGSFDTTIRLWNLEGENIKTIELNKKPFPFKEEVWAAKLVSFTSNNKYIVAGISTDEYHISGTVQLLDIKGNPIGQPFGNDWRFALSPNGKYIAVGDANNTIQLWDMKGNRIGSPFRGHENSITSLAFSPNGRFIASGSWDKTVRLWDTKGNLISTFLGHQKAIESITFSPDGQYIASASQDGIVRLWPSNWKTALKVACNRLRHHPVLTDPKTDEEKSAARTCLSYGRMDL